MNTYRTAILSIKKHSKNARKWTTGIGKLLPMNDFVSSQEKWSKFQQILTSLRGIPLEWSRMRYVWTPMWGERKSLEKKNIIFLVDGDRARTKKKNCLSPERYSAQLVQCHNLKAEFEWADRHKGYKWRNTSPQDPFHAASEVGVQYICALQ